MSLRKKIIRLAHENPELRPHLLPLLKKAMEHPSEEALKQYLKEHPKADPSQHTVSKPGGKGEGEGKPGGEKIPTKAVKFGPGGGRGPEVQVAQFKGQGAKRKNDSLRSMLTSMMDEATPQGAKAGGKKVSLKPFKARTKALKDAIAAMDKAGGDPSKLDRKHQVTLSNYTYTTGSKKPSKDELVDVATAMEQFIADNSEGDKTNFNLGGTTHI